MAKSENNLKAVFQDTANAIRSKTGSNGLIEPRDFADEISSIETGIEPTGTINITANGEHDVKDYAFARVSVIPTGTLNITQNGTYDVALYGTVYVSTPSYIPSEHEVEALKLLNISSDGIILQEYHALTFQDGNLHFDEIIFDYDDHPSTITIVIPVVCSVQTAGSYDKFIYDYMGSFSDYASYWEETTLTVMTSAGDILIDDYIPNFVDVGGDS